MISGADLQEFFRLVRRDNRGLTGWTRRRSSLRFTLDAIDEYNRDPSLARFRQIQTRRNQIPAGKKLQYKDALDELDSVLEAEEEQASTQELVSRLAENKFRVTSGLEEYKASFGEPFAKKLLEMGSTSRWLDGGAGEAKAMLAYLEAGGKARCTATGYAIPAKAAQAVRDAGEEYKGRFEYISGKYFGDITDAELDLPDGGDFDLITDLNGVLYYTQTVVEDLTRYLRLLKPGGVLICTNPHVDIELSEAEYDQSRVPGLAKWGSNISGIRLEFHYRGPFFAFYRKDKKLVVPPMNKISYTTNVHTNSPTRKYRCSLELPKDPVMV